MDSGETYTRRGLLKTGASVGTAGAVAAAASGSASAQEYGGHLDDVDNYNGETADATGMEEVTVLVGAGNTGLRFDPPAVLVDPGTTINWEWTGAGGAHNVHHDVDESERVFRSGEAVATEGVEYSFTFEDAHAGSHPYVCQPHRANGMKGVVVVGEDNLEGDTFPFGETGGGLRLGAIFGGSAVFGAAALLGVAAYRDLFGEEESEY